MQLVMAFLGLYLNQDWLFPCPEGDGRVPKAKKKNDSLVSVT